jgi:membrane glycosyltransferase
MDDMIVWRRGAETEHVEVQDDLDLALERRSDLPAEAPLAMPAQPLDRARPAPPSPPNMRARRNLVFSVATLLTAAGIWASWQLYQKDGWTPLEIVSLVLFVCLFHSISAWFCSSFAGLLVMLNKKRDAAPEQGAPITTHNAILMPVFNEDPDAVVERLSAIDHSLAELGLSSNFDIFILSDTRDAAIAVRERVCLETLRKTAKCRVYYRRRRFNSDRKAGNLAEWTRRFGAAYESMLVLDADSLMSGKTIRRLVETMDRTPRLGLIQTVPVIIGAQTLFQRYLQFGVRLYGRVAAAGLAWWTGPEGSYWGHNAVVRVRAFASAAGLPHLPGRRPFGGAIMSHDVVEGVLLRRAGWEVRIDADYDGSYEEAPPSLVDFAARDRRWCQGNVQHGRIMLGRGIPYVGRLHLFMGLVSYMVSPLWLCFLVAGLAQQFEYGLPVTWENYMWWVADESQLKAAAWLTSLTTLLLFGPKLFGCVLILMDKAEVRRFGGWGRVVKGLACEALVSVLLAPVLMLAQTRGLIEIALGRDCGWTAQRRTAESVSYKEAYRVFGWQTVTGAVLIVLFSPFPGLLIWTSPILLGLVLIQPMTVWSARQDIGAKAAASGLWATPEEADPSGVLVDQPTGALAVGPWGMRPVGDAA